MRIIEDQKLDFKDVLILPKRSTLTSRSEVSLEKQYTFVNSGYKYNGVPLMAANMDGVGEIAMASKLATMKISTCLTKHIAPEVLATHHLHWGTYGIYSLGITNSDLEKFERAVNLFPINQVCIDVANGYTQKFVDFIRKFRDDHPAIAIYAGNVCTPEMTEELLLSGVDVVKVGIGPSRVCKTREITGVGYPQLSAVIECADAAHGLGGHIISDGGVTCPGDLGKAFGAGADFVMIGSAFAGHDEGGGEQDSEGNIIFYGMSSDTAMMKHSGKVADYRASEGRTVKIKYRGPIENTIKEYLGGLRSTCTYVGARSLKELPKRTTFIRVNQTIDDSYKRLEA